MLVIGLLAGFVGGFLVGQRMAVPLPVRAADVPRPEQSSPGTQSGAVTQAPVAQTPVPVIESTPVPIPEVPTAGIVSAPADEPAQRIPAAPAGAASPRAPVQPAPREPVRPAVAAPAMLELASRPPGAVVFVDDVRVGVTPVTINDVTPGTRRVRMELPPHRPWTTSVDVAAGAHLRIGASLE